MVCNADVISSGVGDDPCLSGLNPLELLPKLDCCRVSEPRPAGPVAGFGVVSTCRPLNPEPGWQQRPCVDGHDGEPG